MSNTLSQTSESFRKKSMLEDFRANVLKINFHTNSYDLASSTAVVILGALWFYLLDLLNSLYPTQPHSLIAK